MRQGFLIFVLLLTLLDADIDDLIESMQNVSPEKRFEIMNRFKEEVIQLQEEERMDAMLKLISITESSNAKEVLKELESNSTNMSDDIHENSEQLSDLDVNGERYEDNEIEHEIEIEEIDDDD